MHLTHLRWAHTQDLVVAEGKLTSGFGPQDVWLFDLSDPQNVVITNLTNTPTNIIEGSPTWAPDDGKIAFAYGDLSAATPSGIWTIDPDGSNATRLVNHENIGQTSGVAWAQR